MKQDTDYSQYGIRDGDSQIDMKLLQKYVRVVLDIRVINDSLDLHRIHNFKPCSADDFKDSGVNVSDISF